MSLVSEAQRGGGASDQSVTVGVLREDSVLVPFARFDGRRWQVGWPQPDFTSKADMPPLNQVPSAWWAGGAPSLRWELLKGTAVRQRVEVAGTAWYELGYGDNVGLATNYITPLKFGPKTPAQDRWILAGTVATRAGLLMPVAKVGLKSSDADAIRAMLPNLFARVERDPWLKNPKALAALDHSDAVPHLAHVHERSLPDGRRLYLFHALRNFDYAVTSLTGWLSRKGNGRFTVVDLRPDATDVDGKGGLTHYPLASLTIARRTFWMIAACGYESGGYELVEVSTGKPTKVAEIDNAGCLIF